MCWWLVVVVMGVGSCDAGVLWLICQGFVVDALDLRRPAAGCKRKQGLAGQGWRGRGGT